MSGQQRRDQDGSGNPRGGRGQEGRRPQQGGRAQDGQQGRGRPGGGGGRAPGGGGGGRPAGGGRPPGSGQGGGRDERREPAQADTQLIVITPAGSSSADVVAGFMPPKWTSFERPLLLQKDGVYVMHGGVLPLSRNLEFQDAVLVGLWDDADRPWTLGWGDNERVVRAGLHALVLVPGPGADAPPWVPVAAEVKADPSEFESGLLSPWADPDAANRVAVRLAVEKGRVFLSATRAIDEDAVSTALVDTLTWLAQHPDNHTPAVELTRLMLVQNGHGLQRLGLSLTHAGNDAARQAIADILVPLSPRAGALIQAVWEVWHPTAGDARPRRARFIDLVRAVETFQKGGRPAPTDLALVATWVPGLFGFRPERENLQPARSLYLACQVLRQSEGRLGALDHPDFDLPDLPLSGEDLGVAIRDLTTWGDNETDLDRVVRALATAESASELHRPRLEHLRNFFLAWRILRNQPLAGRALLSRHDYVLSLWSFRGLDVRGDRTDARRLAGAIVVDTPSLGASRSLARVLGNGSPTAAALAQMLGEADHPVARALSTLHGAAVDDVIVRYQEAASRRRINPAALHEAIDAAEWLIARAEADAVPDSFVLLPPEFPDARGSAIRAHFFYWRAYCRSLLRGRAAGYETFLAETLPRIQELPVKLHGELLALLRTWMRLDPSHRSRATAWLPALHALTEAVLANETLFAAYRGERGELLWTNLAELDGAAFADTIERMLARADWDLRDVYRLIEAPRRAGQSDGWLEAPAFRALHPRLATMTDAHGMHGRAEWTRTMLHRAHKTSAVAWMLDGRRYPEFVGSGAFRDWFADRGRLGLQRADDALIEVLELAVAWMPDAAMDEVLASIGRATLWSEDVVLRLLLDAARYAPALGYMSRHACGTAAQASHALTALIERATSGRALLHACALVRTARERFGDGLVGIDEALAAAFARYQPHRVTPQGLAQAAVGASAAGLAADSADMVRLVEALTAAAQRGPEGGVVGALTTVVLRALRDPVRDALLAAARDATPVSLDSVGLPAAWTALHEAAQPRGRRGANIAIEQAAQRVARVAWLDALAVDLQAGPALAALAANGFGPPLRQNQEATDPTADDTASTATLPDGDVDSTAAPNTTADDDAITAEEDAAESAANDAADAADDGTAGSGTRTDRYVRRLAGKALRREAGHAAAWLPTTVLGDAAAPPLLAALRDEQPIQLSIRPGLFDRVRIAAQQHDVPLHEVRDLMRIESLAHATVEVDPVVFDAWLTLVLDTLARQGRAPAMELDRDGLVLAAPLVDTTPAPSASPEDAADADTGATTDADTTTEADTDTAAEADTDATAEASTDADTSGDAAVATSTDVEEPEEETPAQAAANPIKVLIAVAEGTASEAARDALFASPLEAALFRRALAHLGGLRLESARGGRSRLRGSRLQLTWRRRPPGRR